LGNDSLDKSLAKHGFHRDDMTDVFMTHLHFDHCGGSVNWNKDKTGYEVLLKMLNFGPMIIIGNGQQNQMQEKKLLSFQKIFCQCKKAVN
jgi:metal-dependent hydrolase (beta-lactamase superfamily II)